MSLPRKRTEGGALPRRLPALALAAAALLAASEPAGGQGAPHPDLAGFEAVVCTDCHDDRLEGSVIHPPTEDCTSCHEPRGEGDETTMNLQAPVEELCVLCHDHPAQREGLVSMHPPAAEAMCTVCHDPHSSDGAHLLPADRNVCLECHVDLEEELERPYRHGVIDSLGCTACHDPHGSSHETLLRSAGNQLCLACHAGSVVREEGGGGGAGLLAALDITTADLEDCPKVSLDGDGRGHPVAKHPVRATSDPRNPGQAFGCRSCHEPHAALRDQLIIGEARGSLCFQCHRK